MNKYDGKKAFWDKYETLHLYDKLKFLEPLADKILKDVLARGNWQQKRERLIQELIKGFDSVIEVKNNELDKWRF